MPGDAADRRPAGLAESRERRRLTDTRFRRRVGLTIAVVAVLAYAFTAWTFSRSLEPVSLLEQAPPGGVAVDLRPVSVDPVTQTITGNLVVFPDASLLDEEGRLTVTLEVEVTPSAGAGAGLYLEGRAPSPKTVTIPAPGVVERYPFDTYQVTLSVRAATTTDAGAADPNVTAVPVRAAAAFALPGWTYTATTATAGPQGAPVALIGGTLARSWSTKTIAVLLLALMVVLAVIAMAVVNSSLFGRMKLELSVASWLTAMLFALLPIRSFLPGSPPLGSWIDIGVFFWVEMILMVCVALVAVSLLRRRREERTGSGS